MSETKIQTNNPAFDEFYPRIKKFLQADVSEFLLDGRLVRGYRSADSKPIWLRDHTLMMKGYKYFEKDMTSAAEHFAETQAANGCLFCAAILTFAGELNIFWKNNERKNMSAITERIEINPAVMLGKPVIRGTRIPVELVIRKLSEGATEADLLDAYPRLVKEDIQAALAYAAASLAHETIVLQKAA
jgi:uncharacterized protein (DUF433 family)